MLAQYIVSRLLVGGLLISVLGFFTIRAAGKELADAQADMEAAYNRVLESIRNADARSEFENAQSAWTSYRDRSVAFLRAHSHEVEKWEQLELDLTRERTSMLRGLLITGFASGHDWPMFGGSPSRNAVVPNAHGPMWWQVKGGVDDDDREVEEDIGIRWAAEVGYWCSTQPVVSGNLVWVATHEWFNDGNRGGDSVVLCFDRRTGRELYRYDSGQPEKPSGHRFRMPMSCTPLIEEDLMWFRRAK